MSADDLSGFPEIIIDLEQIIGLDGALLLVEAYPGIRLKVPKNVTEDHRLAKLLGIDRARTLVHVYGNDHINVPRCVQAIRENRNARLFDRRKQGATHTQLALEFSLTERYVYALLARGPIDDRQLDLFERV